MADDLVVEIKGLCEENVVVNRERVTLRGTNPASDGIRAAALDTPGSFALLVRSSYVRIENLKITGGQTYGLVISHTSGYGRFGWESDRGVTDRCHANAGRCSPSGRPLLFLK